ncbi:translation initiation factor eIF3 subunit (macronuclear) [Tetrahymena thermophila SB210]|uniref:Translation initiation factor eIF3 subunit n=1 Tax=Tetrahymena thermophila (strain SB210) TaxID=312017 RepID=A4VCN8_TETTS|nr:translation initiation factor eIF3 subunit [Tetrahymena thermophila SB210]EDK31291.2 translation initiation factor eIF3 subunit [Tetrahymena thermophila SB210]|eukprot:XP_001471064.2 translation initiation factor eIF3 subunit [Tetrahymena thermophila SB210]
MNANQQIRDRLNTFGNQQNLNDTLERKKTTLRQMFQAKTVKCEKLSKSGMTWNHRLLEVSDHIRYYSVEPNKQLKGEVALEDVFEITFPDESKKNPKRSICFTFRVDKYKQFKNGQEIQQKITYSKNKTVGHLVWAFKFTEKDMDEYQKIKDLIEQNNQNLAQMGNSMIQQSQFNQNNMQGQQQKDRLQDQIRLQSQNEIIEGNDQENNQEDIQKDSDDENQKNENQNNQLNGRDYFQNCLQVNQGNQYNWDEMYNKLFEIYYQRIKQNKQLSAQEEIQMAIYLFTIMGKFREESVLCVKELIHELIFPEKKRSYIEVSREHPMYQFKQQGEKVYEVNRIFVRLSYIQTVYDKYGDIVDYEDVNTKNLSNEFKANNYLTNTIHDIVIQSRIFELRIPLTCQVEYLGFNCLCYAVPKVEMPDDEIKKYHNKGYSKLTKSPLDAQKASLIQGFDIEDKYKIKPSIEMSMKAISDKMKLEQLISMESDKKGGNFLSYFCEVHDWDQKASSENKNNQDTNQDTTIDTSNKLYYIYRTSTVLPLHIEVSEKLNKRVNLFKDRLREEYACRLDKPMSNSAFIVSQNTQQELRVTQASTILINSVCKQVLDDLESLKLIAIGPESIIRIMHKYGVNMRHLGKIANKAILPHVKNLCIAEMIARSTKKILRANISTYILKKFRIGENFDEDDEAVLAKFYGFGQTVIQPNNNADIDKNQNERPIYQKLIELKNRLYNEMNQDNSVENNQQTVNSEYNWILDEDNVTSILQNPNSKNKRDYKRPISNKKDQDQKDMIQRIFQRKLREIYWDYLNLVFSNDEETKIFWQEILRPQIHKDFGYDIGTTFPIGISEGFVIHSIKYHWRINFHVYDTFKLFTAQPFGQYEKINFFQICVKSKIYNMKNLNIHKLVNLHKKYIEEGKYDLAFYYLQIKEILLTSSKEVEYNPPQAHELSQILINQAYVKYKQTKSQFQNLNPQDRQQQIDYIELLIKQSMKYIPLFHGEIIKLAGLYEKVRFFKKQEKIEKPKNFDPKSDIGNILSNMDALTRILEFHLGRGHPLYSFLLCFQANQKIKQENLYNLKSQMQIMKQIKLDIKLQNWYDYFQQQPQKSFEKQEEKDKYYQGLFNAWEQKQEIKLKGIQLDINKLTAGLNVCLKLYEQAIDNSLNTLGNYHIKIAEFQQDFAIVDYQMFELLKSLKKLHKALCIIENWEPKNPKDLQGLIELDAKGYNFPFLETGNVQKLANLNIQIALIETSLNRYSSSLTFVQKSKIYLKYTGLKQYKLNVYTQYLICYCLYNMSLSSEEEIQKLVQQVEDLWTLVDQNAIDQEFKPDQVSYLYQFCFKVLIEQEMKQLDFKSKLNLMNILDEENERQEDIQDVFDNYAFKNNFTGQQYVMRRKIYTSSKLYDPFLKFKEAPITEEEKLEIIKQILQSNQQIQEIDQMPKINQSSQNKYDLNLYIKSVLEDIEKQYNNFDRLPDPYLTREQKQRFTQEEQIAYLEYQKEANIIEYKEKIKKSISYRTLQALMKALGFNFFYYAIKKSFSYQKPNQIKKQKRQQKINK